MDYYQSIQHRTVARGNRYLQRNENPVNINFEEFVRQIPNHPRPDVVHETLESLLRKALEKS